LKTYREYEQTNLLGEEGWQKGDLQGQHRRSRRLFVLRAKEGEAYHYEEALCCLLNNSGKERKRGRVSMYPFYEKKSVGLTPSQRCLKKRAKHGMIFSHHPMFA
jgi:hypothetical protein